MVDCLTPLQAAGLGLAYATGSVCWQLTEAVAFASPIPATGPLNLWNLPTELEEPRASTAAHPGLPTARRCAVPNGQQALKMLTQQRRHA
jgi:hypothetical protein